MKDFNDPAKTLEAVDYEGEKESFLDTKNNKIVVDVDSFVKYLLKKYTFKTIFGTKKDSVWLYEDGIYKLKGEEIIKIESEEKLGEHCKNNPVQEIIGKIKRKTAIDFEEFENTPINLIPLSNGLYNFETGELELSNPEKYFKFKLPLTYDPKAVCPIFLKFVEETLYPDDIKLVQEWFGFCLYRKYLLKKGMIWFGDTDTGKTTMINILEGMIGKNNCSGLSLQKISGGSNFDLSALHCKVLNSFDDLSSADINDGGGFKIATGGGSITAEYKFGDQFKFSNSAKLLFACNKIPSPKDIEDPAYFSRWLPVPFDNQVDIEDQDPLFSENCLKNESSGILNWALEGLDRLLKNKIFSSNKSHEEVKSVMCRSGNPIVAFVQDKCFEQEGLWLSKTELYDDYCGYMREKKLPIMTPNMFGRNVKRHCHFIVDGQKDGKRGWYNIRVGSYKYEKIN